MTKRCMTKLYGGEVIGVAFAGRAMITKRSLRRNCWKEYLREDIMEERPLWEASEKHLGRIWEASGKHLGRIWEASGKNLGCIWEHSECIWNSRGPWAPGVSKPQDSMPL